MYLSTELLMMICQQACMDGGQNAAHLRLVSRLVNEIVTPYRFFTIHASGEHALDLLLDQLGQAPDLQLSNIRHLYLSDTSDTVHTRDEEKVIKRNRFLKASTEPSKPWLPNQPPPQVWSTLSKIMMKCSPHVQTLSLLVYTSFDFFTLETLWQHITFQELRHLHVLHDIQSPMMTQQTATSFPVLEVLELYTAGLRNTELAALIMFTDWGRQIPTLSHVIWRDDRQERLPSLHDPGRIYRVFNQLFGSCPWHTLEPDFAECFWCQNIQVRQRLRVDHIFATFDGTTTNSGTLCSPGRLSPGFQEFVGMWPGGLHMWAMKSLTHRRQSQTMKAEWQQLVQRHLEDTVNEFPMYESTTALHSSESTSTGRLLRSSFADPFKFAES
jgi:hypothetical protein